MGPRYRTGDGEETEAQQQPVHAADKPESAVDIRGSILPEPSMQEQGFEDKQQHGEEQPYRGHRMQPPELYLQITIPGIRDIHHVETRYCREHDCDFCLQ